MYEKYVTLNNRITASTVNAHTQEKLGNRPTEALVESRPTSQANFMRESEVQEGGAAQEQVNTKNDICNTTGYKDSYSGWTVTVK